MLVIKLKPSNILPKGEWSNDTFFKVHYPSNGGWFCYNLEMRSHGRIVIYENIEDDSTLMKRIWHRIARRYRCRRASAAN